MPKSVEHIDGKPTNYEYVSVDDWVEVSPTGDERIKAGYV